MLKPTRTLCAALSVSALLFTATPAVVAQPPANPVSVDESAGTTFVATGATTVAEINKALAAGKTHVVFTEDVNLTGSITANTNTHPVTLVIKDGVTVDLTAPGGHAIVNARGAAENPLTISNSGTLAIHDSVTGIKSTSSSPVVLDGGTFTFRDVTDYNLHFESAKGDLTVRNADVSIITPTNNGPGAINTGHSVGAVTWDNSTVFIDDQGTTSLNNSAANTAIYSEAGKWIFTNGTQFHSITHNYYNLSLVGTTLEIDKGKTDGDCDGSTGSKVTLETAADANTARHTSWFNLAHPVVGLNLARSADSVVNGTLKVIDHVPGDHARHGIELQDAVLTIGDQGHVDTPSVGYDSKQTSGPSIIAITPNSGGTVNTTTHWGNGNPLPASDKLTFIISKGSNVFDQKNPQSIVAPKAGSHADAVTTFLTKNDRGVPVQGLSTKPDTAVTDPVYSYGDTPQDTYTTQCTKHPADKPNIWVPTVKVSFFPDPFTRTPETVSTVPKGGDAGTPGNLDPLNIPVPSDNGPWTPEGSSDTFTVPELTSGTKTFDKDTNAYKNGVNPVTVCPGKDLPDTWLPKDQSGFTWEYGDKVDTSTPGDKSQTVHLTFPANGSNPGAEGYQPRVERDIVVPVHVSESCTDWSMITPIPTVGTHTVTVFTGDTVDPKDGLDNLPDGATVTVDEPAVTDNAGNTTQKVTVTFSDGSSRKVTVPVIVKDRPTVTETTTTTSAAPTTVVSTVMEPTTIVSTKNVPTTVVTTVKGKPTTIVTTKQVPTTIVTTKAVPTTITKVKEVPTTIVTTVNGTPTTITSMVDVPTTITETQSVPTTVTSASEPTVVSTTVTAPPVPTTVTPPPAAGSSVDKDAIVPLVVGGLALGAAVAGADALSSGGSGSAPAAAPAPGPDVVKIPPAQAHRGMLAQTGANTVWLSILGALMILAGLTTVALRRREQ